MLFMLIKVVVGRQQKYVRGEDLYTFFFVPSFPRLPLAFFLRKCLPGILVSLSLFLPSFSRVLASASSSKFLSQKIFELWGERKLS